MSEERDVETRLDAVLADARDALEAAADDGEVSATPTLRAVASAASTIVEDADSETLLDAVDLGGEDGYDTIVTALSEGDEEHVRELRQLLRLSKLADSWDDPDADERRRELPALFGLDATTDDEADETGSDEATADDESDTDDAESGVADDIVETVVERFTAEGDGADTGDDAPDADEETTAGTDDAEGASAGTSLRSQVEDAVDRLREGVGEEADEADEDDERKTDEDETTDSGGSSGRLSTIPKRGRNPSHLSTIPEGESATRFSTMPKRR
ncbi:hypothetical protein [Halomarina oriensis]|uniref:Uncharacterized protein n=1 Tax=Halomarina oriensis TaxID=671145 RepID=A0A6B0GLB8_9EURY|nr:hypothetical protein [Halomarina oriensis]MWG34681.1 hypothetical protein [Halomarina oriensis]